MSLSSNNSDSECHFDDDLVAMLDSEDEGEDGELCPRVRLSAAEKVLFWKPWKSSIIVKVLGKRVGFSFLAAKLYEFWQKAWTVELIDLVDLGWWQII